MTARKHDEGAIILTRDEAARIRQVLIACTGIFDHLEKAGGPALAALQEAALSTPDDGRPLARVHYDACLAVDYIDFPRLTGRKP